MKTGAHSGLRTGDSLRARPRGRGKSRLDIHISKGAHMPMILAMRCPRCSGCAMRVDVVTPEVTIAMDRCVNCGHVFVDALIMAHRQHRPEPYSDATLPKFDPEKSPYLSLGPCDDR
jgi:hypothetical protein